MRFKVKDNNGNIHTTRDYIWDKDNGIPPEETILEDMEKCDCMLNESNASCEGDCIMFDEGEVIEVINSPTLPKAKEHNTDFMATPKPCSDCGGDKQFIDTDTNEVYNCKTCKGQGFIKS